MPYKNDIYDPGEFGEDTRALRMHGRATIYTDLDEINETNVVQFLEKAMQTHEKNAWECDYLWNYYKGDQPIIHKTKSYRKDVNNIVVVNHADEIMSFSVGHFIGNPVQYANACEDGQCIDDLIKLNKYLANISKAAADEELAEWFHCTGIGYRLVTPNLNRFDEEDPPFLLYTLDPRTSFIAKSTRLGHRPMAGVTYQVLEDGSKRYSVYTDKLFLEVYNGVVESVKPHILRRVPIIEYKLNLPKLGCFETVLTIMDCISRVSSDRVDSVQQFVDALLVFQGVNITDDQFANLKSLGGVKIPKDADVKYLVNTLSQADTQTLLDDMYDTMIKIVGLPNYNSSSGNGDTGTAVELRNGWQAAGTRAKRTELFFKQSEREALALIIDICNSIDGMNLKRSDIDIRMTRRDYENLLTKTQALTTMLASDKIHPRLAFESVDLFPDPELAYNESAEYEEEQTQKAMDMNRVFAANEDIADEGDDDDEESV